MADSGLAENDRGYAAIAWWLIPLGLLITLVIVLFGSEEPATNDELTVTPVSAQMERVTIGESVPPGAATSRVATGYIAPDQAITDRVLQRLREFQVDFRQTAPAVTVVAAPGSGDREKLADALTQLLAQARLAGTLQTSESPSVVDQPRADIVLYARRADRDIVHRLLVALSPYLQGSFLIAFNPANNLDRLLMVIQQTPRFREDGQVLLWRNATQAAAGEST